MRAAKALASLRICVGLPRPSLLASVIGTKSHSCADNITPFPHIFHTSNHSCSFSTPGRWQPKTLLTIDKRRPKSIETVFLIAICRVTMAISFVRLQMAIENSVLTIFDLFSSIVLTFSISAFPVCLGGR